MITMKSLFGGLILAGVWLAGPAFSQTYPALTEARDDADRARIQKLVEAARKEGALEWIGGFVPAESANKVLDAFKAHYGLTGFRTEYTFSGTGELITRMNQLLAAKSNNFDVMWTSSWAWYKDLLKRGDLMEYESPSYAAYTLSDAAGLSEKGYWVSDGYSNSPLFNADALKKLGMADFKAKSWNDLVDPRLKGLVSIPDPIASASGAQTFIGIVKVMGPEWIGKLVANQPVRRAQAAQASGWIATGEIPVTFSHAREALPLKEDKISVVLTYPDEGIVLQPFPAVILKSAPRPNAAKLFIDFVRSAKGAQAVMDAGVLMFFGRPGVKSPDPALQPGWEEIKVIPLDYDTEVTNKSIQAIRQEFRKAGLK
jgi:iron(III) transport system substrate-binding protein